jgi:hypothetical protein
VAATGSPDQLTGCVDRRGNLSKLQQSSKPIGGTRPKGTSVQHLRILPEGVHGFSGASHVGAQVLLTLDIPEADKFPHCKHQDPDCGRSSGAFDVVEFGPFAVSYEEIDEGRRLCIAGVFTHVRSADGNHRFSDPSNEVYERICIGGEVIVPIVFVGPDDHLVKVDYSWTTPAGLTTELSFSHRTDRPVFHSSTRGNIWDPWCIDGGISCSF